MRRVTVLYYVTILMVAALMIYADDGILRVLAAGLVLFGAKPWFEILRHTSERHGAIIVLQHVESQVMADEEADQADRHRSTVIELPPTDDDEARLDLGRSSS